jgi:hypothetical protein
MALAQTFGVTVLSSERGRGKQQNWGAQFASGDALLFLHADTLLPDGAEQAIHTALSVPMIAGGNFSLCFAPPGFWNTLFARIYNYRSRTARHYYGDSCLFIRRHHFEQLGGFREGMLMEDWEFIQRWEADCRLRGRVTVPLPLTVTTSSRRFSGKRRWRYIVLWCYLHYLHAKGVSGDALARLYPDTR